MKQGEILKMKIKGLVIALLTVILLTNVAFARDGKFAHNPELTVFSNKLHGNLNLNNNNDFGLQTDFQGDKISGFGNKTSAGFGWLFNIGKLSDIYAHYEQLKSSGRLNVKASGKTTVTLNGKTFGVAGSGKAVIDADIKIDCFDILGARELTKGENGYLDFVYGFKIMKATLDAVDANNAANSASYSLTLPLPNFGVRGFHKINDNWGFYGQFSGFSLNRSGKSGTLRDLDLGFEFAFKGMLSKEYTKKIEWFARIGYKDQYLKGKDNNNELVMEYKGPVLKVVGRF